MLSNDIEDQPTAFRRYTQLADYPPVHVLVDKHRMSICVLTRWILAAQQNNWKTKLERPHPPQELLPFQNTNAPYLRLFNINSLYIHLITYVYHI